jgi:hypothetical protein
VTECTICTCNTRKCNKGDELSVSATRKWLPTKIEASTVVDINTAIIKNGVGIMQIVVSTTVMAKIYGCLKTV